MGEPACEGLITKVLKLAYRALNLVLLVRLHRRHACPHGGRGLHGICRPLEP